MNYWQKKYAFAEDEIIFGLIGEKLSHSFSKKFFTEKFRNLGLKNYRYELFEIPAPEDIAEVFALKNLRGLNVTIPYKEKIIPLLDSLDTKAEKIGAVNTIKINPNGFTTGFNTDYDGFLLTLEKFDVSKAKNAIIIGKGGAAKAVAIVLADKNIVFSHITREHLTGSEANKVFLSNLLAKTDIVINTTPLGMYPNSNACPDLPYNVLNENHIVIDLVYNPEETLFLQKSNVRQKINGLPMLYAQAEKAWEIYGK